jgi:plasmid maintenance system killer protein
MLKTHMINALSGRAGKTIYSIWIEDNLRAVFYISKDTVFTVDIGEHEIYR